MSELQLATGASIRTTGPATGVVVLCVNGGTARPRPGTWSASVEYLVRRLAPRMPDLGWVEVKYRVRSWKELDWCIEDANDALDQLDDRGAREVVLLGYSMGGAVAAAVAGHRSVRRVIGLAPWLPEKLDMSGMRGRRFDVFHGSLDRYLPGIPGVSPASSRAGFERLLGIGVNGTYTMLPFAGHALALRAPWGSIMPLPRAARWADLVSRSIEGPRVTV